MTSPQMTFVSGSQFRDFRRRLPTTRQSYTHRVAIRGKHKVYIILGLYDRDPPTCPWGYDDHPPVRPGEIFITMDDAGSTLDGFADSWAIAISMLLQAGCTLEDLCGKFAYQKFEPAGMTDNPDIPNAHSLPDYVCRWMYFQINGETWEQRNVK